MRADWRAQRRNSSSFCSLIVLIACKSNDFHAYQGQQQHWPTAPGAFIDTKYAVPAYYGYPPRAYTVLGSSDEETHGRFSNALASAAEEAQKQGADAILVLSHAHHAEGSVGVTNGFGNVNAFGNSAFFTGTATTVNIPHRVDQAQVMLIKWVQ
jgi:hypothetical protein